MKSSTAMLVLSQFAHTGAKIVLFILLTQIGGFETAGAYTYALAFITPTFIFFGLSLRPIFVTSPSAVDFRQFLFLRCIYGSLGIVLVLAIAWRVRPELLSLFAAMAIYRFVESLVDIRIAQFQRASRIDLMALATFMLAIVTTGSLATAFVLSQDLVLSVVIGSFLGTLLFFGLRFVTPKSKLDQDSRTMTFRQAIKISKNGAFLSTSAFLVSMGTSIPVLILGASHGTSAVGAYSSIYHLSSVSNILFSAVSQAELRVFADLVVRGKFDAFSRRARRFSVALASVGLLAIVPMYLFGTDVFSYVFGEDFSGYRPALMAMVLSICIAPFGFFLDVQLTALQRFSSQTIISIFTLVFTALCALLMVPAFAIFGATLTLFLTMFVRNIVKAIAVARLTPRAR